MRQAYALVLFDGVCNLCSGAVRFIYTRDPAGNFRFASLQSDVARAQLARFDGAPDPISTMIVIRGDELLAKSDAVLEIARGLKMPWRALYVFKIVPRRLRDAVYDFIARRRYQWFGKKETCMVPTPELRSRFLE